MKDDIQMRAIRGTLEIIAKSNHEGHISTLMKLSNINDTDKSEELSFKGIHLDLAINKKRVLYYEEEIYGAITEQKLTCDDPEIIYHYTCSISD